jgi:GAF domain-containing protein
VGGHSAGYGKLAVADDAMTKRGRKTTKPKHRNVSKVVHPRNSSIAKLQEQLDARTRELVEALEQQTATSEVLRVISSSPADTQPVFKTIAESAARLCNAQYCYVYRFDGTLIHVGWFHGHTLEVAEIARKAYPMAPGRGSAAARSIVSGAIEEIPDVLADVDYAHGSYAKIMRYRSIVAVPMLKDGRPIGAIAVPRPQIGLFPERQIQLLQTFADQAVIAIENVRLFEAEQERTAELTEALEQQTATADVLRVISSSPGELGLVFDRILESAIRICNAKFGALWMVENDGVRLGALYGATPAFAEATWAAPFIIPGPMSATGRVLRSKQAVQVLDLATEPGYANKDHLITLTVDVGGGRTLVAVPMLRDSEVVGAIVIFRQEVEPFNEKQIVSVQNFAAQAVIAIENTRLLNELRESLEQQTATADVLRVISSSPGDLEPVFQTMLENATRICEATFGNLFLCDGSIFRAVAASHGERSDSEYWLSQVVDVHENPGIPLERLAKSKQVVHISDLGTDPSYSPRNKRIVSLVESAGARTFVAVPMLKEGELIGAIAMYRQEVRPFTDKQIELVKNFAAQAVIAIENTRLLKELRERTNQLEAQSQEVVKLNQKLEQRVADQVGEIERMGRLRRFLPPQVADLIVASGTEKQLESHRREITALFCDLRGFTGFTESADAEDVMALLRDYHAAIGEIIIKYSGTLERYAGDGVMVVFNDPVPVENPALQAVLMALEMRDVIGALAEKWRRLGHDLGFGIGIAHGFATLGTIGFEGRFDYAAIGTVSNVASRLCDEAKPGQILISPRVLMAVEDAVTVEPIGDFALKGIRRPLTAHNVLAVAQSKI